MPALKRITILGLGLSGQSAARALRANGVQITAWDDNEAARDKAQALGITLSENPLKNAEALLLAPGISHTHPIVQEAKAANLPITCDIALWRELHPKTKTIGITGTNGKSTITAMIAHIQNVNGKSAHIGGNFGVPVFDLQPEPEDIVVLELSSYQLELCEKLPLDVAVLSNITPDHLDRHGSMETYAAIKATIFNTAEHAVIATDDEYARAIADKINVDLTQITSDSAYGQNAALASAAVQQLGISKAECEAALASFENLPHRQQRIAHHKALPILMTAKPPMRWPPPERYSALITSSGLSAGYSKMAGWRGWSLSRIKFNMR